MLAELVQCTPNAELLIERAMRVCHGGDVKDDKPNKTFIQGVIKLGHESPLEHGSATFKIEGVSRALTHQLVRHRIASYTQKSQRYVKENPFEYIIPPEIENNSDANILYQYHSFMAEVQKFYNKLINAGLKREDARYVLPNACCTSIYVTMNFREFRNFIKLRSDKHAQWEIRELSDMILSILYEKFPIIFEDLFVMYFPEGLDVLDYYDENGKPIYSHHIGPEQKD